jgi:urease alpha subunit
MSLQTLESDLFIDLSDEQAEMVNAGGQLLKLHEDFGTSYEAAETLNKTMISSGPNGSSIYEVFNTANVETYADKNIKAVFE